MKFRNLRADEIDVRIGMCKQNGLTLLLYKDARADMNVLDETVGAFNWKREHKLIGDRLYCTVSIYCEDRKEWISKEDVGTESNTEKEKGQASDAYKRACVNWGIGRELYTSPFIWVTNANISNGKCYDKFKVEEITYNNGVIKDLVIKNISNGTTAFTTKTTHTKPTNSNAQKTYKCECCGTDITYKIAKYSYDTTEKKLCMKCQKAHS